MYYYYIDETYRSIGKYYHCNIGGLLFNPETAFQHEVALEKIIKDTLNSAGITDINRELKYDDFLRDAADCTKISLLTKLSDYISSSNIHIIISHSYYRKCHVSKLVGSFGSYDMMIQSLSFFNLPAFLSSYTENSIVQIVADLGLSESFRSVYNMYRGGTAAIRMAKSMGIDDRDITTPNFSNLPLTLFLQSSDSRLMQMADIIIGLDLANRCNQMTPFKQQMYQACKLCLDKAKIHSIEWNQR